MESVTRTDRAPPRPSSPGRSHGLPSVHAPLGFGLRQGPRLVQQRDYLGGGATCHIVPADQVDDVPRTFVWRWAPADRLMAGTEGSVPGQVHCPLDKLTVGPRRSTAGLNDRADQAGADDLLRRSEASYL